MRIECISCAGQGRGNVGKKDQWTCDRCGGSGLEPSRLTRQVTEFHKVMGQPIVLKPTVPSDDRVRLRLKLIAEEFFELLDATLLNSSKVQVPRRQMEAVMHAIENAPVQVELPEFVDALADLDYVIEGTRLEFGINGAPIADAVHAANIAKVGSGRREDGKVMKPEGWKPPDIAGELRKQGWEG